MKNISNLSLPELKELKSEIEKEIKKRESLQVWINKTWEGETYIS